ncbi:MAG: rane protein of unknown function [Candidatus Saccharibacteria bacterium]|nr:rane protein of unknown function [Candidatus Saccharibacteria bacterium]
MIRRLFNKSLLLRLFAAPMIVALIISSGLLGALNQANAVLKSSDMTPEEKIESVLLYRSVGICLRNAGLRDGDGATLSRIQEDNATTGKWFNDRANGKEGVAPIGAYMRDSTQKLPGVGDDYKLDCDQPEFILKALKLWKLGEDGNDNGLTLLCNVGFVRTNHKDDTPKSCITGSGDLERKDGYSNFNVSYGAQGNDKQTSLYQTYMRGKIYNTGASSDPISSWGDAEKYWYASKSFNWSCGFGKMKTSQQLTKADAGGGDKAYNIYLPQNDGTVKTDKWFVGVLSKGAEVIVRPSNDSTNKEYLQNCESLASDVNFYAQAYAKYALNKVVTAFCTAQGMKDTDLAPCIQGGLHKSNTTYCADTYKTEPYLSDCKKGATADLSGAAEEATSTTGVDSPDSADQPCEIDGALGWIICPAIRFLAGISDGVFTFLADSLLKVDPKILATGTQNPTYNAWVVMRNVANIAFVLVFLIIIFSQITGAGITNYGVKKMLPRLIIAAILVNLSYFVCQIAVDLSNILGYSVKTALEGIGANIMGLNEGVGGSNNLNKSFTDMTNDALAQAGSVLLLLSILIPIMLAGLIAIIVIVFMLIGRQAILVILIVISPLAFVAFLLPNTQNLFTQWRKIFTTLLLMFPIISAIFGLSSLTSTIISSVAADNTDGTVTGFINQIIGAGILVLPLFVVPFVLKKSLDGIGSIGALMNAAGNKAKSGANAVKGAGKSLARSGRDAGLGRLANSKLGSRKGVQFLGKAGGVLSGRGKGAFAAMGKAQESKQNEALNAQWERDGTSRSTKALQAVVAKHGVDSYQGRAAISKLASKGDADELAQIRKSIHPSNRSALDSYDRSIQGHHSALKEKNPSAMMDMDPAKWSNMKATETYKMKDGAINEGINTSTGFAATIMAAANDKLTEENYSPSVRAWAKAAQAAKASGQPIPPYGNGGGASTVPTAGPTNVQPGPATGGNPAPTAGNGGGGGAPAGSPVAQGAAQSMGRPGSRRVQAGPSTPGQASAFNVTQAGQTNVVQNPGAAAPTVAGAPTQPAPAPTYNVTINSNGGRRVTLDPNAPAPAPAPETDFTIDHSTPAAPAAPETPATPTTPSRRASQPGDLEVRQAADPSNQGTPTVDENGFQAPRSAGDDYQDGMNK